METEPPCACELDPATTSTSPPSPCALAPTNNAILPDDPPVLAPVDKTTAPELPETVSPVLIFMTPLEPAVPAFAVDNVTSPLVDVALEPLAITTLPPVTALLEPATI